MISPGILRDYALFFFIRWNKLKIYHFIIDRMVINGYTNVIDHMVKYTNGGSNMDRNEKNMQTLQKIMDHALLEFSKNSYREASLNSVCASGNLSKGIIYHYFKDKDNLYLVCVKECFDALTKHLRSIPKENSTSIEKALENYFDARIAFLGMHPIYCKLFCNVVMNPPAHLSDKIADITADFDALNLSMLTELISNVKLRSDVSIEEVVDVFREYQDFVNTRFQMQAGEACTLQDHENRCHRSLKILLYGVIDREEKGNEIERYS